MLTAIMVGRANVGKSSLFNQLIGRKKALVADKPGVTRDWQEAIYQLADVTVRVIDTPGMQPGNSAAEATIDKALKQADLIFLVLDGKEGVNFLDQELANKLRKQNKPLYVLINKCDCPASASIYADSLRLLGISNMMMISAIHKIGFAELHEIFEEHSKSALEHAANNDDAVIRITIMGRPNVGKSTFINNLLQEERLLAGPQAGLTRDAIMLPFNFNDQAYELVDTAGLRRKSLVREAVEKLAVADSFTALQYTHVAIVMIDANQPFEKQDLAILGKVISEGRIPIILANKWDQVRQKNEIKDYYQKEAKNLFYQCPNIPILFTSALKQRNWQELFTVINGQYHKWNQRISTGRLNKWLQEVTTQHQLPLANNKKPLRLKYITQHHSRPPRFYLSANKPEEISEDYLRYLKSKLQQAFDLTGIPAKLYVRKNDNPYHTKAS